MPEENEVVVTEPELVDWESPDGIKAKVPADQLKSFNGLTDRFNKLTTKEQELSKKERSLESGFEEKLEGAKRQWFDGMTQDEWKEYGKQLFGDLEAEQKKLDEGGSEAAALKRVEKIEAQLKERDQREAQTQKEQEVTYAERALDSKFRELAEGDDGFKSLTTDVSRNMAIGLAWDIMRESNFDLSEEDAVGRAVKEQAKYESDIIEAHRASKKSGPGLPGTGGESQRPKDLSDERAVTEHLTNLLKSHIT